jgi:hypothetical protein
MLSDAVVIIIHYGMGTNHLFRNLRGAWGRLYYFLTGNHDSKALVEPEQI